MEAFAAGSGGDAAQLHDRVLLHHHDACVVVAAAAVVADPCGVALG